MKQSGRMVRQVGAAVLAVAAVVVPGAAEARTAWSPPGGRQSAFGYVGSASSPGIPRGMLVDATSILSPSAWGAGQIVSDGDDVTAFLAALMRGRLVPASFLEAMETRVPGHGYGLGLIVADSPCGRVFGHHGDVSGYRNVVWATADGKRVAAVMVNVDTTRISWSRLRAAAETALCST